MLEALTITRNRQHGELIHVQVRWLHIWCHVQLDYLHHRKIATYITKKNSSVIYYDLADPFVSDDHRLRAQSPGVISGVSSRPLNYFTSNSFSYNYAATSYDVSFTTSKLSLLYCKHFEGWNLQFIRMLKFISHLVRISKSITLW